MRRGRAFPGRAGRWARWVSWIPLSALLVSFPRPSLAADIDVLIEDIAVLDGKDSPKIDFLPGEEIQVRVRLRVLKTSGNPFVVRLRIAGDGWYDTRVSAPVVTTRSTLFGGPNGRRFTESGAGPGKVALLVDVFSDQEAVSIEGRRHGYLQVHCPEGLPTGAAAHLPVGSAPVDMALTGDGRYLYVTSREDRTVTVIDAGTKSVVPAPQLEDPDTIGLPAGVAPSANGQNMYVVDAGYQVLHVIDADTQVMQDPIPLNPEGELGRNSLGRLAVSPSLGEVYITDSRSSRIVVLNLASGRVDSISLAGTPSPPQGLNPVQVMLDPNPQFLYVLCNASNEVIKLDVVGRRIVDFVQLRDVLDVSSLWPVWSMALSGNQIYVVANPGGTEEPRPTLETKIYVLPKNNLDARPRQEFRVGSSVWDLVVREDGLVYGIDSYRGEILIMDMSARIEMSRCAIPVHAGGRHLRADFDRNRLFVGGWLTGFVDIVE